MPVASAIRVGPPVDAECFPRVKLPPADGTSDQAAPEPRKPHRKRQLRSGTPGLRGRIRPLPHSRESATRQRAGVSRRRFHRPALKSDREIGAPAIGIAAVPRSQNPLRPISRLAVDPERRGISLPAPSTTTPAVFGGRPPDLFRSPPLTPREKRIHPEKQGQEDGNQRNNYCEEAWRAERHRLNCSVAARENGCAPSPAATAEAGRSGRNATPQGS